uniref:Uncharacterized protein n=1 Tax=Caenorhabditis japonica TaxID=281687 RepID=A0A8R1IZ29_CAEJA
YTKILCSFIQHLFLNIAQLLSSFSLSQWRLS